ncbi:HLA class II histocompatibility antigen, DRB1-15 beta chain-like, partial [Pseudonaja textilis]|uniref:HLA class II histocompatibility antigen, DRB1-15 beta chain-like n=1 Tax=Pseudonaja textilis TaxID=8673 RepID=UPI000EA8B13E
ERLPSVSQRKIPPHPPLFLVGPSSSSSTSVWERWALESLLTAFLLLLLLLAAHFLLQEKSECIFLNGTQRVRLLDRFFYDRQEYVRFDSDLGKFVAVTALGEADADYWNGDKQIIQYRKAAVDFFCRYNYEVYNYEAAKREERVIGRR